MFRPTVYSAGNVKHMIRLYVTAHGFQALADATQTRWMYLHKVVNGDWFPGSRLLDYFGLKQISGHRYVPDVEGII
jgi:hypothetical protein